MDIFWFIFPCERKHKQYLEKNVIEQCRIKNVCSSVFYLNVFSYVVSPDGLIDLKYKSILSLLQWL